MRFEEEYSTERGDLPGIRDYDAGCEIRHLKKPGVRLRHSPPCHDAVQKKIFGGERWFAGIRDYDAGCEIRHSKKSGFSSVIPRHATKRFEEEYSAERGGLPAFGTMMRAVKSGIQKIRARLRHTPPWFAPSMNIRRSGFSRDNLQIIPGKIAEMISAIRKMIPPIDKIIPTICKMIPTVCKTISAICKMISAIDEIIPPICKMNPTICKTISAICKMISAIDEIIPPICKMNPTICKTISAICKMISAIDEIIPPICKMNPTICKTISAICKIIPAILQNFFTPPIP